MDLPHADPKLLNLALQLSLEWGPHYRKPIRSRLRKLCPDVTPAQADELDVFARKTREWAHELIARSFGDGAPPEQSRAQIAEALPWIDASTLRRLWGQGCFYAVK